MKMLFLALVLVMAQTVPGTGTPGSTRPLVGTYWKATEIGGKAAPAQDPRREAHLVFEAGGRYSGSDGCNGISGAYELKGDRIKFGTGISTQKACIDIGDFDAAFRGALKGATRLTITADRLELADSAGKRLAIFTGRLQAIKN
jgi:heat shock protein HslJ